VPRVQTRKRRGVQGLAILSILVGCAEIPQIHFVVAGDDAGAKPSAGDAANPGSSGGDGEDGGPPPESDGGVPPDTSAAPDGGSLRDGSILDSAPDAGAVDSSLTDAGDDGGGDAATILCGSTLVSNCAGCDAGILRCKTATADQCVSDCTACAPNRAPCVHCPTANALPRGVCVPVGADGELDSCNAVNLCACTTDTDCPAIENATQTCAVVDSGKTRCLTCGVPATAGLACVSPEGATGTCKITAGAMPSCN
jgi:hypothetical protein